jgi:hypothetical protein
MVSRWAIGAYGTIVNINQLLPTDMKTSLLKDMPFPTGKAYEPTWSNLSFNWLMILVHIAIYLSMASWLQKKKMLCEYQINKKSSKSIYLQAIAKEKLRLRVILWLCK